MSDELTVSLHCLTCSPAAPPLEDDNLLAEILLRLPPLPSSLPRASAVCTRWRSIATDTRFHRRFRIHHRRSPPLIGCFVKSNGSTNFESALEAPNRVPLGRFSFPVDGGDAFQPIGCRHGLVLAFLAPQKKHLNWTQLLVWDPVTGEQHRLEIPPGFYAMTHSISAAVIGTVGDAPHFQVVLVGASDIQRNEAVASVYSLETVLWVNLIKLMIPLDYLDFLPPLDFTTVPAVMIGDSLYWKLVGSFAGILEFDLEKQCLAITRAPLRVIDSRGEHRDWEIVTHGGDLCFLLLTGFDLIAQLWKSKKDCDGVYSWVLETAIALHELLSIKLELTNSVSIIGFAEHNNVVLLRTSIGVCTVHLESLQFKKLFESPDLQDTDFFHSRHRESYYPFEGVYTADRGIGGVRDGAELLQNA